MKIDFIVDLEILTLSLVTFLNITLKAYLDDNINGNEQCWKKITSKKVYLSMTKGTNHKDWLYCRFGNSYSKSCYFFDSNHITLKVYLDDTIYGNEQFQVK